MTTRPYDKHLVTILGILVCLTLLTPLFFWPAFYSPFSSPTLIGFLLLVELALPIYLILAARKKDPFAPLRHPIVLSLTILILALILTSLTGVDPLNSFMSTIRRPMGVLVYLHGWLLVLYLFELFAQDVRWKNRTTNLIIAMASLISLYALGEGWLWPSFVANEGRTASLLANPTFLASFLILPAFLSFSHALQFRAQKRWLFSFLGALMLLAIMQTQTRGALLGVIVGVLVGGSLWFLSQKNTRQKKKALLKIGVTLGTLLIIVLGLALSGNSFWLRLTTLPDQNISTRLIYWDMAWQGWREKPLLGVGPENFYMVADQLFTPDLYDSINGWPDKPHSTLLERLVTTGLVGTIAWLILLGLIYKQLWKRRDDPSHLMILAGLTAYQVQGLFFFDGLGDTILFLFIVAWIGAPMEPSLVQDRPVVAMTAGSVGTILAILGIWVLVVPFTSQVASAGKGEIYKGTIVLDDILVSKTAYALASDATNYQLEQINKAITLYQHSVRRHPQRQALWNDLALLFYLKAVVSSQDIEEDGIAAVQRAAELAPGRREAAYIYSLMQEHHAAVSPSTNP